MTQKIYGLVSNNGDGSASMHWFRNSDIAYSLIDSSSDKWDETYNMNDSGFAEILEFPDNINLEQCGFYFHDAEYAPSTDSLGL